MKLLRDLTPLGIRVLVGAVFVLLLAGFLILQSCHSARTASTEAKLNRNQTSAALASGADAVETLGDQAAREAAIDRTTKENADAIRSAPGADAPVTDELDAVARERLCRRAVYRVRPECLQFPAAD
jgi:type II secretory pathway component PulM